MDEINDQIFDLMQNKALHSVVIVAANHKGETGLHMKAAIPDILMAIHILRNEIRRIEALSANT